MKWNIFHGCEHGQGLEKGQNDSQVSMDDDASACYLKLSWFHQV